MSRPETARVAVREHGRSLPACNGRRMGSGDSGPGANPAEVVAAFPDSGGGKRWFPSTCESRKGPGVLKAGNVPACGAGRGAGALKG